MIEPLLESAFPVFRQVQGYPICDIYERPQSNNPWEPVTAPLPSFSPVATQVPCVFSRSDARTDLGDNTINTNTSFFFLQKDIPFKLGTRHLIRYRDELYSVTPGGVTSDWGIVEARVIYAG